MPRKSKESKSSTPDFNQIRVNRSIPPAWPVDKLGVDYSVGQGYYNRDIPRFDPNDVFSYYQKEGLLQRVVDRECSKLFTKWFTVLTPDNPDSDLPNQVYEAMDKHNMRQKLPQWHHSRMLFGCGWLMHQLSDIQNVKELANPPDEKAEYLNIMPISKNEWLKTERSGNLDRDIKYYSFNMGSGESNKEIGTSYSTNSIWNVHPDRLIINTNDPLGVAPEGMSEVGGGMAHLDNLMNILTMLEVGLFNRCFSVPIIEYPAGMDEEQINYISNKFKGINSADNIMIPRGKNEYENLVITFDRAFSDIGNIQPLIDLVLKIFSTTVGQPYALLFGTPAGGLSGSEMNSREYLSGLSAKLKLEYTPLIRKIIDDWRKFGVIKNSSDKYEILWPPLYEMTEEEEKKVLFLESNRAVNLNNIGIPFSFLPNGFIDNNSISGEVATPPSGATIGNPKLRSPDLRNPSDEAEALRNAKTPEELAVACRNMRLKLEGLQRDADYLRNESIGDDDGS